MGHEDREAHDVREGQCDDFFAIIVIFVPFVVGRGPYR
jgi:hypothetical protein